MYKPLTYLLILMSLLSLSVSAEIFKTVDKNGRTVYTDTPPANTNAQAVELKSINSLPPTQGTTYTPTNNTPNQIPQSYEIYIKSPVNGDTLLPTQRSLTVTIQCSFNVGDGMLFSYKIDGASVGTSKETTYIINEPPRGEHKITVELINEDNKSLAQSDPVAISVMRPIIKQK